MVDPHAEVIRPGKIIPFKVPIELVSNPKIEASKVVKTLEREHAITVKN